MYLPDFSQKITASAKKLFCHNLIVSQQRKPLNPIKNSYSISIVFTKACDTIDQ